MALPVVAAFLKSFAGSITKGLGKSAAGFASTGEKISYGFGKGISKTIEQKFNAVNIGQKFATKLEHAFTEMFGSAAVAATREASRRLSFSSARSGVSASRLSGFGNAIGMYGGTSADIASTVRGLNAKANALNFGNAEWLNDLMLKTQGQFNIYGSGARGFKTGEELLDEFNKWAQNNKELIKSDPGRFEDVANQLGISESLRMAVLEGEYANLKAQKSLTEDQINSQKVVAKLAQNAEVEKKKFYDQAKALGERIRRPFDLFALTMQKWAYGGLADILRPAESKDEAEENAKKNREAILKTLNGEEGGFDKVAAKANMQEAAVVLNDMMKMGVSKEDIQKKSVQYARTAYGEDEGDVVKYASRLYSAAITGVSKYTHDSSFDKNPEIIEYWNNSGKVKLKEDVQSRNKKEWAGYELYGNPYREGLAGFSTWIGEKLGLLKINREAPAEGYIKYGEELKKKYDILSQGIGNVDQYALSEIAHERGYYVDSTPKSGTFGYTYRFLKDGVEQSVDEVIKHLTSQIGDDIKINDAKIEELRKILDIKPKSIPDVPGVYTPNGNLWKLDEFKKSTQLPSGAQTSYNYTGSNAPMAMSTEINNAPSISVVVQGVQVADSDTARENGRLLGAEAADSFLDQIRVAYVNSGLLSNESRIGAPSTAKA